MARYTFATLDQWTKKTEKRIDAVLKDATQSVVAVAQQTKAKGGRMPVDTGNLRNSLQSSIAGGASGEGKESYIMVAGNMKGGDLATFTWTAEYAAAVNNGNRGRPGAHFVEGAVDQWPAIVRASIAKAKARVG
jgi:HK97 gp10 family phage protein